MRLVSYYTQMTLPVLRRAIYPLSTLSERGHTTFFMHVSDVREMQTANYHLILLPNWTMPLYRRLPPLQGMYVYDLSDPALLEQEEAIHVLRQCHAVTVPVPGLVPAVKPFCGRVKVMPSLVHAPTFMGARRLETDRPVIACVGDHDWEIVAESLRETLRKLPQQVRLLTDSQFLLDYLGTSAEYYPCDPISYPALARTACMALLPRTRNDRDTIWVSEFGLCGVPCIASPVYRDIVLHQDTGLIASSSAQWSEGITALITAPITLRRYSIAAQAAAREMTTTRGADNWLHMLGKMSR